MSLPDPAPDAFKCASREDIDGDVVMIFDGSGNAYKAFGYTPEDLEAEARLLRKALGEQTTVTFGPSSFITDTGGTRRV